MRPKHTRSDTHITVIGFRAGAGPFFIWIGITQLQVLSAIGQGFAIGCAVPSITLAGVLAPLVK